MIVTKKKGISTLPPVQVLLQSFHMNPDGVGIAWSDGETLKFKKGFFRFADFLRFYKDSEFVKNPEKYAFSIHFRLATHGGSSASHLHPFVLDDSSTLLETEGEASSVFFHNGVLNGKLWDSTTEGFSDTMEFVKGTGKILGYDFFASSQEFMGKLIGYNKFVLMRKDGDVTIINPHLGMEVGGVWYSNKYLTFPQSANTDG